MDATVRRTFSALAIPNYRRYFTGQSISLIGTWMQSTAQAWLVLQLTHSATALGIVIALQTLPMLVLGPYGGVIADRVDKRRLMIVLQSLMGVQALVLAVLTITNHITYADVLILALLLGLNNCFENPSRQAFVLEMVGPEDLRNAVSLNSTLVNAARAVGPAVAGVLIATVGEGWCFLINAGSFVAVVGVADDDGHLAAQAKHPHHAQQRPATRGIPIRRAHARASDSADHDGPGRDARLQLPGDAPGRRQAGVRWRRAHLRPDDGGDGYRGGGRGTRDGRARTNRAAADGVRLVRVRCRDPVRRPSPQRSRSSSWR